MAQNVVVSDQNMRITLLIIVLLITSCTTEVYNPINGFHFKVEGLTKAKLMLSLDHFADLNSYTKLSEGGEGMLAEAKRSFMMATYQNEDKYEFLVENVLGRKCFTVATYDKGKLGKETANELSIALKKWIKKEYQATFQEYDNQYCK